MTAMVRLERWVVGSRPGPLRDGLGVALMAAGAYLLGGWRWGVVGLLAGALLAWAARSRLGRTFLRPDGDTFHPEFLWGLVAAFVAAGASVYGGWRWGVVGLSAAALLACWRRARRTEPSLPPDENGGV